MRWLLLIAACAPAAAAAQSDTSRNIVDEPRQDEIIVTGSIYRGEVSSGGARIDAKIQDLPLSISVVTKELIEDRQVRNLRDLSENVAGVRSRASGSGAFAIDFSIRGLQTFGQNISVNGFRVENFSAGFDPQAVERVEFIKGPASVLYGASGALSGLVNVVTKTPLPDNFLDVDFTGGTPAYGRATVDANVRVTDHLDARVNGALTGEKVLNAFQDIAEQSVTPAVRWHPNEKISLLVEGSYFHAVQPSRADSNYPPDRRFTHIARHFKIGERWSRDANSQYGLHAEGSVEIADGLTLRQGVNLQHYHEPEFSVFAGGSNGLFEAPDVIGRTASRGDTKVRYLVSQSEVRWNFDLLGTTHKLLAGYEHSDEKFGGSCCESTDIAPLDLDDPVYGAPRPDLGLTQYFNNTIRADAYYVQDFIEWRRFKLLAGLRYDDTNSTSAFCDLTTPGCPDDPIVANPGDATKRALSPRLGLVWQPRDRTTLFVSWSKSFNPNVALDRNNKLLPPERGIQYEVGVREELLDPGKLTLSLSAFDLTRRNIASCDPQFALDCSRSIAVGEQRVKGVELELSGKPLDWIDLIATYAYLHGRVTKSDLATTGIAVGSRLPEAAPHSASLLVKAGLAPLGVKPVAVSAGIYYVARRPGRDFFGAFYTGPFTDPLIRLPASTRVDFAVFWDVSGRIRLQANLTNAFDTRVYEPVNVGFNITQRRRATLGANFRL